MDIATSGVKEKNRGFRFLEKGFSGQESRRRYAHSASCLLFVVLRIFFGMGSVHCEIHMNESLRNAARNLRDADRNEEERFKEAVHKVYMEVFFEKGIGITGAGTLFASVIAASLCVTCGENGEHRFRTGREVNPTVQGILYTVSCCSLVELAGHWRRTENGRKEQAVLAYTKREKEILGGLRFGARIGASIFVDLRGACKMLRDEETLPPTYIVCNRHSKCGILMNIEFSMASLKEAVAKMLEDANRKLHETLLCRESLPEGYEAECMKTVDDERRPTVGYWWLSDTRNENFQRKSLAWMDEVVWPRVRGAGLRKWVEEARRLHELLLCLLHLTGGAPGRGREIASIAIRNTQWTRRGLFLGGAEAVLFPTHNKTVAMRQGSLRIVFRFLDVRTTLLWKLFFALVHPLLVTCRENGREEMKWMDRGRDFLCLSSSIQNRVTEVIGACFAKYSIPFNFRSYRQWQRGYVKTNGLRAGMVCTDVERHNDEEEDEEEIAAIEQAGHSRRTAEVAYAAVTYAGESGSEVAERARIMQRRASLQWHKELGIENTERKLEDIGENEDGVRKGKMEEIEVGILESIVCEVKKMVAERMSKEEKGNKYRKEDLCEKGSCMLDDEERSKRSTARRDEVIGEFCAERALRRYLKDEKAVLRNSLQEEAMKAVAARKTDIALILRTGFGKTAVVCAPIMYETGVTLWVAPLRALLFETKKRMESAGIYVRGVNAGEQWHEGDGTGNVVLVSPEHFGPFKVVAYAKRLGEAGKLNRIVIDEAHIPLMSWNYRECMGELRGLQDVAAGVQRV